jgi:chemotaxis protein methyltransferase CheR
LAPNNKTPMLAALKHENDLAMSDADFGLIVRLVKQHAGIHLGPHKRAMVYARLASRVRDLGMTSFESYCATLAHPRGEAEIGFLVNAITTNFTRFFRERHHFDHLAQEVVPAAIRRAAKTGRRRLRIWSAACATGEEAYSIAMILRQCVPDLDLWDARVLATDISTDVLAAAEAGIYGLRQMMDVPNEMVDKYFRPTPENPDDYKITPLVSGLVTFNWLNLLENWPMEGPFDAIFCRNVIIYFDKDTQRELFRRLAPLQRPGDLLFLGHSEGLFKVSGDWSLIGRTIYRRGEAC